MLVNDSLGATLVAFGNDRVGVDCLDGDHTIEGDADKQWFDVDRIVASPGSSSKCSRQVGARILFVMAPFEWPGPKSRLALGSCQ